MQAMLILGIAELHVMLAGALAHYVCPHASRADTRITPSSVTRYSCSLYMIAAM